MSKFISNNRIPDNVKNEYYSALYHILYTSINPDLDFIQQFTEKVKEALEVSKEFVAVIKLLYNVDVSGKDFRLSDSDLEYYKNKILSNLKNKE